MPFITVPLEECLMDGPPFQHVVASNENLLVSEDSLLRGVAKASRSTFEVAEAASRAYLGVAEAFDALGRFECEHGDDQQGLIVQFGEHLKAVEAGRRDRLKEIDSTITVAFAHCLKHEVIQLKELKRKNEKARMDFTIAINRFMVKKKGEIGANEAANEVSAARKELHESNLAVAFLINEMIMKRKSVLYQNTLDYLDCRLALAEQEAAKLREIRLHMQELSAKNAITTEAYNEAKLTALEKKHALQQKAAEAYNPLSGVDTNAASPFALPSNLSSGPQSPTEPERSGFLYKRSSHAFHPSWGRRFFSLKGDALIYYSLGGKGDQNKVNIDLRLCNVQPIDDPERRFCFDLISPIRAYRLQAENEADLHAWIEAIRKGVHLALQHNFANSPAENQNFISREFGISKGSGQDELIRSILDANGIQLSLSESMKRQLKTIPGNSLCADCRAANPDWASISFGILVCIQCSGIHRSLGVHLSKIRSLNLDFWNPEHVELMQAIGNENSWAIFEEKEDEIENRPHADSTQAIKENWIMAKYGLRQFLQLPSGDSEAQFEQIRTMLWDAIERDDVLVALRALALGAPVDDTLADACEDDETEDVNNDKCFVRTALQRASELGHWRIVSLLLLWGADIAATDSQGRNLVHYLSNLPAERIPVLLSVLRKDPSLGGVEDESGITPLQMAENSQNGQVATVLRVFKSQCEKRSLLSSSPSGTETPLPSSGVNMVKEQLADAFNKVLRLSRPFKRGKKKNKKQMANEEKETVEQADAIETHIKDKE